MSSSFYESMRTFTLILNGDIHFDSKHLAKEYRAKQLKDYFAEIDTQSFYSQSIWADSLCLHIRSCESVPNLTASDNY